MNALREILAKFGVEFDDAGLQKGEHAVEGMVGKLEHLGAAVATAFAVHEIKEWWENIFEGARALDIQSQTLGMSAEALQTWKYAAHMADVNADMFAERLNRLQVSLFQASKGHAGAAQELKTLGVEYKDTHGKVKSVEEVLLSLADAVSSTADVAEKKALVRNLFGKGGDRLVNILNKGRAGLQELHAEFKDLGGGYDEEFLKRTEEVEDAQKRVHYTLQALNIAFASKFLPLVEKGAKFIEKLVRELTRLQKAGAITNAAMALLTGLMIVKLPIIIGFIAKLARMVTLPTVLFAALVLLVDELITTFQGGDTYIRDFIDSLFGDEATAHIVENIKTISSEVAGLIQDFDKHSKSASDTSLVILSIIQTIGLVFTSVFGTIEASVRVVWRALGDLQTLITKIANAPAWIISKLFGADIGDHFKAGGDREYSTTADYGRDIEKGLGSSADRVGELFKTLGAIGNQAPGQPSSVGAALAAAGEMRPDVAAFMASQGARPNVSTQITQQNTFHLAPGSTQAQAKEVAGAVDTANKASYRAAEANLVHKAE